MPTPKEVFELRVVTDDPRFEGFALTETPSILGRESLDEDLVPGFDVAETDPGWTQQRLGDRWRPPLVVGRVAPFNDYPGLDMVFPAFSKRAVDELSALLQPNGELLPLRAETRVEYFFYNITTISDALDHGHSKCDFWSDPPTTTDSIDHFAFHSEKLSGLSIFRLREWPVGVLVTDEFVRRVEQAGLNGFDFVKVWPLDPSTDWRKPVPRRVVGKHTADDLKLETVVLILPVSKLKPSAAEKKVVARFKDELDAQLLVASLSAPYFGSLEGDDIVGQELRIFLTTPDADRLVDKLRPWLETLVWPAPVGVLKRRGRLRDADASEELSTLEPSEHRGRKPGLA